jgi:hypothetical protein
MPLTLNQVDTVVSRLVNLQRSVVYEFAMLELIPIFLNK